MALTKPTIVPSPRKEFTEEDRRLWIGNLDTRISEFQLLKIVQKYGSIEKFDLMYHRGGPLAGQSRGFAFVTFTKIASAELMLKDFNGKKLGNKAAVIKWAHSMGKELEKSKTDVSIPALGHKEKKTLSRTSQINAIESKLKMMEELPSQDFQISNLPSTSGCLNNCYNQNKQLNKSSITQKSKKRITIKTEIRQKPYFKK